MDKGFLLIGKDCENIIKDYYYQLVLTEKYDRVMKQLKREVYFCMISPKFSMIKFGKNHTHYYGGTDYLMIMNGVNAYNERNYIFDVIISYMFL